MQCPCGHASCLVLHAAVLLNHWSEEDAYWGLVAIVNDVLKGYYSHDMLAIQVPTLPSALHQRAPPSQAASHTRRHLVRDLPISIYCLPPTGHLLACKQPCMVHAYAPIPTPGALVVSLISAGLPL